MMYLSSYFTRSQYISAIKLVNWFCML